MTMTAVAPETSHEGPWTVDDLSDLPDDGQRYELIEGSLLVSPAPRVPHVRVANRLRDVLSRQCPDDLAVGQDGALLMTTTRETYFIPDVFVVLASAYDHDADGFDPADMRLAVEVLSLRGRGTDLVTKRYYYGAMRIPRYWIVDPKARTLTVLALDGNRYRDEAVVQSGQRWHTEEPFKLALDPADFC
jgi:Uma2 family endonuclease